MNNERTKKGARPAGGTAERAKGESHWTSGNPYRQNITGRSRGQGTSFHFIEVYVRSLWYRAKEILPAVMIVEKTAEV